MTNNESKLVVLKPGVSLVSPPNYVQTGDMLSRVATSVCYKAENHNRDVNYLKKRMVAGHDSILRAGSVTFRVIGNRSMSHQLVRHHVGLGLLQESLRYCVKGKRLEIVLDERDSVIEAAAYESMMQYRHLREKGKRKAEYARLVLPICTKTEVVITFNFEALASFIKKRALNSHAQLQIRSIAQQMLVRMRELVPEVFADQYSDLLKNPSVDVRDNCVLLPDEAEVADMSDWKLYDTNLLKWSA